MQTLAMNYSGTLIETSINNQPITPIASKHILHLPTGLLNLNGKLNSAVIKYKVRLKDLIYCNIADI
jgi:hypothetical protein